MGYVDVAGRQVWHEVDGAGDPVVLLHGGFSDATAFDPLVGPLTNAGYRVYRPERTGHGRTPDTDAPLSYESMATETIAYLDAVLQRPVRLVGWSDGACVAVLVAMKRPDLISQQVLIGQYYNESGRTGYSVVDMFLANREGAMSFLRQNYDQLSPDGPDHFPVFFDKTVAMWQAEPQLSLDDFAAIAAPTLVLQGDRDEPTIAHGAAVATALADGHFAVLPGTHGLPLESPDLVSALLQQFFHGIPPPAFG